MLGRIKDSYLIWCEFHQTLPKTKRYSLGQKIDNLFIETIEAVATAGFLNRPEKLPYVRRAIQKLDTLKILLLILWETKALDNKKYADLSVLLDEIGKMLGGWNGQLVKSLEIVRAKQNSPAKAGEK